MTYPSNFDQQDPAYLNCQTDTSLSYFPTFFVDHDIGFDLSFFLIGLKKVVIFVGVDGNHLEVEWDSCLLLLLFFVENQVWNHGQYY